MSRQHLDTPSSRRQRITAKLRWTIALGLAGTFCLLLLWDSGAITRRWGQMRQAFTRRSPVNLTEVQTLFADVEALGVIAIGHAEGNLTVTGDRTAAYWGHADPANQRQNQGWCSAQGRGGGDPDLADQKCLEYAQARLPQIMTDFHRAGLDPVAERETLINTVDLYNQASPWVSRQFPAKYVKARRRGKTGEDALVWARVEAFRREGRIDASGLIGICRREERPVSDWDCVAQDQRRRIQAIARVLNET